ncbi:MAG: YidH family protein [Actinomycetes bacterium]
MPPADPAELDVDARFLLANERTLLAWVRTALTLVAGGVGIEQFARDVAGRQWFAVGLLLLGVGSALAGAVRFARADAALKNGRVPATGVAGYLLAGAVALVGVSLLVALLLG